LVCSGLLNPLTVYWLSPSKLEEVSCYCYESQGENPQGDG